jgi:cell division protein FtsI (penicillin-binding protein 3)
MSRKARKWLRFRVTMVAVLFFVLFVGLLSRAVHLQIISGNVLKGFAERQHTRNLVLHPERNMILDRNGQKLAATIRVDSIYADPSKIIDTDETAFRLSKALGIDRSKLAAALSKRGRFCWIARQVSPDKKKRVTELGLEGVYTVYEPKRFYPHRELACHVLGFTGIDSSGLEGLELYYDNRLKTHPRNVHWGRDAKGNSIYRAAAGTETMEGTTGADLVLTIDGKIQYAAELELQKAVRNTEARSGTVVVMDVHTGEILAMANAPSYNLNAFKSSNADVRRNRAVTDTFEPGSVFKPFVMAAALEEGVITEQDVIDCEEGSYAVRGRIIREANAKKYGLLGPGEVLKRSSNIGMAKIAERIEKDSLYRYLSSFGFGSPAGVDLPGEVGGVLRSPGEWRPVDLAALSFGQGVSITVLQIASAMSAIANDGVLMRPYVVKAMVDETGTVTNEFQSTPVRRVISPVTARRLTAMLKDVVESDDGTGSGARISGVSAAGKTGTSQKFDWLLHQYSSEKVVTSFAGFFPADDPKITVVVVLDEPIKNPWGGASAAPVFSKISQHIVTRFNRDIDLNRVAKRVIEPEFPIIPASAPIHGADTVVFDSTKQKTSDFPSPDFTGLSMREVLHAGKEFGIDIRVSGSGWAVSQKMQPPSGPGKRPVCFVSFSNDFR